VTPTPIPGTPSPSLSAPVTPLPSPSPTAGDEVLPPSPSPAPTLPVPDFPLAGPTPTPTPLILVTVTPKPTPPSGLATETQPDLDIMAIEITQGIQDLNNNMPLVAGRRTYARVYIDVNGATSRPHTYGALEARRAGQQIGWIWPENGPITARANGGDRLLLDDSLYFRLPNSWLHGTVTLTAFVYSEHINAPWSNEPAWENNFQSETVIFHEAQPLNVHLVTLHLHRSFHPADVVREYTTGLGQPLSLVTQGNVADSSKIVAGLWRYHPISSLALDVFPISIGPIAHSDPDEWDLGDCSTLVVEPDPDMDAGLWLADWRPLMEDTDSEPDIGTPTLPDRQTIWVLDKKLAATHFYLRAGGKAQVFGSWSGSGPAPVPGAPAFVDDCPNPNGESGQPNSTVALWRVIYDWADAREFFVGMVDPSLPTRWGGLASKLDTAWVRMATDKWSGVPWYHLGAFIMAHEVGHLAGLKHVACKDDDGDGVPDEVLGGAVDPSHPQQARFPNCSLAEVRKHGYYGFDVYFQAFGLSAPAIISNNPAVPLKNRAYPFMAYKGPNWPDPYHYCRLLVYYGVPCEPDTLDEPWLPPGGDLPDDYWFPAGHGDPAHDPGVKLLVATGDINIDQGVASLRGILSIDEPTDAVLHSLARQSHIPDEEIVGHVVARDGHGAIIHSIPLGDRSSAHERDGSFSYELLVPLDPSVVEVEVVDLDGTSLARLEISQSAPTARWTSLQPAPDGALPVLGHDSVVTFDASDADGDQLLATLTYSADGEVWHVIATGIASGHRLGEAIDRLPGSDAGRLRLLVSDGVHTTTADDEPNVVVPNRAPLVWIDSPVTLMQVPLGAYVVLSGSAIDAEGGRAAASGSGKPSFNGRILTAQDLRWSSSIDGEIGFGSELATSTLSAGHHVLTLEATDADGATGSASVELIVDGTVIQSMPDGELVQAVSDLFERRGAGDDLSLPTVQSDDTLQTVGLMGLGLLVVVLVGAWVALSYRNPPMSKTADPGSPGDRPSSIEGDEPRAEAPDAAPDTEASADPPEPGST
jgi:hypothetical protein